MSFGGPNTILMLTHDRLVWACGALAVAGVLWLVGVGVVWWRRSRWDVPLDEDGVTPL